MRALEQVRQAVAAYRLWEPQLHAFAWFDSDAAIKKAHAADQARRGPRRPLEGTPIGVKDIFDTAGIPTEYGSPIFAGRIPTSTAEAVLRLESAGAIMFGKTVTAELAFYAPGPTTNPWDRSRTPGGSSMGSAAAVAAGIVSGAIGSQTNGSVIRPAAFCGVVGFKPSGGLLPTDGMLSFSPTLDQPGVFALTVVNAWVLATAMVGGSPMGGVPAPNLGRPPAFAVVRTPEWVHAESAARANFEGVVAAAVAAGAAVREAVMPTLLTEAIPVHRMIMACEANRFVGPLVESRHDMCSPQLASLLSDGATATQSDYESALMLRRTTIEEFDNWISEIDAVLTLPTPGEAPPVATTGDPRFCTRWSLVGAPAITIPTGLSPAGLPLGTQVVGHRGGDNELIAVARWLEAVRPSPGRPPSPMVAQSTSPS